MSGKELLLSCIVIMHVSFMASRTIIERNPDIEGFRKKMELLANFSAICNLKHAETKYVSLTEVQPKTETIEGITFGNTTEEIQASICAISDYLKSLSTIINTVCNNKTRVDCEKLGSHILDKTGEFLKLFDSQIATMNENIVLKQCHKNVTTSNGYKNKEIGFQIIHSTRQWMETFTGRNDSCI